MSAKSQPGTHTRYHAPAKHWWPSLSEENLEGWASDPDCIESNEVAAYIAVRRASGVHLVGSGRPTTEKCFDPAFEVSADAHYITSRVTTNLWLLGIILVLVHVMIK